MKKISIMYLYSAKGFGGIVRNLSLLVNNLDKERFSAVVVLLANKGDRDADILLDKDIPAMFQRIDENHRLDFASIEKIRSLIDKYSIDILSCHGYKADLYGSILRKFYKCDVRLITMAHGWVTSGFKFQVYYFLDKLAMGYFDKIILVAKGLRRQLWGFMIPEKKIAVINNAIDLDNFTQGQNREVIRQEFNLTGEDKVIGFTGRLSKEKDIETTLYATKEALKSGKNIKFLLAGDGPQKERLKKISKDLGINNRVIFAGYQKDVSKIYRILDLYVSASLREGLPNCLLEAQASGVPCIATDIPGNNDIIKDGINGFLFKPKDYKTLSRKIIDLSEDKDLGNKFVIEGRNMIRSKFSIQNRIKSLESLYSVLMQESRQGMKTLLITEWFSPDKGGSITIYNNVYSRYKKKEVFILTKRTKGWKEYDRKSDIAIYRVPFLTFRFLKPESLLIYLGLCAYAFFLALAKGIEVVHCGEVLRAGIIGNWLNEIIKIPYIVYAHGEEITLRLARNRGAMSRIYNSASFIIANSNNTRGLLLNLGVEKEKIEVIYPGVDTVKFNPTIDASAIKKRYGLEDKAVLLTVGRLEERKGHDMVLKALPEVLAKFPDLIYLIVGTGERLDHLKSLVQDLHLENHVKFAGKADTDELPLYYCCCDIFIMANRELEGGSIEGFGIVFVEAAACGKPVIGGDSGGTKDAILDGVTGFLVDPLDAKEIAAKITTLLENPDFSRKLGLEGRRRAEEEFSWDKYYEKVRRLENNLGIKSDV